MRVDITDIFRAGVVNFISGGNIRIAAGTFATTGNQAGAQSNCQYKSWNFFEIHLNSPFFLIGYFIDFLIRKDLVCAKSFRTPAETLVVQSRESYILSNWTKKSMSHQANIYLLGMTSCHVLILYAIDLYKFLHHLQIFKFALMYKYYHF
jgi:hypothetical protein